MERRKIILDCDPGHDDAIALMMSPKKPSMRGPRLSQTKSRKTWKMFCLETLPVIWWSLLVLPPSHKIRMGTGIARSGLMAMTGVAPQIS